MRAAIIDEDGFVIQVLVVNSYDDFPNSIPAEGVGDVGDWYHDGEFIIIWDSRHPRYTGPYIPPV